MPITEPITSIRTMNSGSISDVVNPFSGAIELCGTLRVQVGENRNSARLGDCDPILFIGQTFDHKRRIISLATGCL